MEAGRRQRQSERVATRFSAALLLLRGWSGADRSGKCCWLTEALRRLKAVARAIWKARRSIEVHRPYLVTGHASLVTSPELSFVIRGVEVAFGFCDESVIVDLPQFVATDSNFIAGAARSCVRSD